MSVKTISNINGFEPLEVSLMPAIEGNELDKIYLDISRFENHFITEQYFCSLDELLDSYIFRDEKEVKEFHDVLNKHINRCNVYLNRKIESPIEKIFWANSDIHGLMY